MRKEGYIVSDIMEFANREEFRRWLSDHCLSNAGVWLLFGKTGGPKTIKASEALEEAIDKLDDATLEYMVKNCAEKEFDTVETYTKKLIEIYNS